MGKPEPELVKILTETKEEPKLELFKSGYSQKQRRNPNLELVKLGY